MIAHREQQIRSFKPEDYYGLRCTTVTGGSVGTMASYRHMDMAAKEKAVPCAPLTKT